MTIVYSDRVKESANPSGTGPVTLLGAETGYQSFLSGVGNSNQCYYVISNQDLSQWEVGLGTYTTSGNTLTRNSVLTSSNSNALVSFSGVIADVFLTFPAAIVTQTSTFSKLALVGT